MITPLKILDTAIDTLSSEEVFRRLREALRGEGSKESVVTVNPEILLRAHEDREYAALLERATMRVVDGFGVVLVARVKGMRIGRVTGRQLLGVLLDEAERGGTSVRVALLEGGLLNIKTTELMLRMNYPRLKFQVSMHTPGSSPTMIEEELVIAAFGAPFQEEWLLRHPEAFPNARVRIGVGGALDVMAGILPTPPLLFGRLGLEWLWRLVVQPRRFKRIFRAVVVFPVTALLHKKHHG